MTAIHTSSYDWQQFMILLMVPPKTVKSLSHRYMIAIYLLLTLLLSSLFSETALAQNEGRWYQVEILVFKRNGITNNDELWRKDVQLAYPLNTQSIPNKLSKATHELGGHNYTLRRDENFRVLFHKAWQQQMWGKSESPALLIRGGEQFGEHKELEGTITIHIGRYLHVSTDLWLSEYIGTPDNAYSDWPKIPALPGKLPTIEKSYTRYLNSGPTATRVITFRQHRRMRSKETHYIDHPLMGIIVRMLPIDGATQTATQTQ